MNFKTPVTPTVPHTIILMRKRYGGWCGKQTFKLAIVNDPVWVESCRLRLADQAAVFRPVCPGIPFGKRPTTDILRDVQPPEPDLGFTAQPAGGSVLDECLRAPS